MEATEVDCLPSSTDEGIRTDNEDAVTIANSFSSARTNLTRVSTISSRISQKSIKVMSNLYQRSMGSSILTANNNHSTTANTEVLYLPPARSTRSRCASVKKGLATLEEEFRLKSRASAFSKSTKGQYESDEEEDYSYSNDIIVEEKTHTTLMYKRISRISRFLWRIALTSCVPFYWLLVQIFVLEKWLLHRSPPVSSETGIGMGKAASTRSMTSITRVGLQNGLPYHDCRPLATSTISSAFIVSREKIQSWTKSFGWLLWLLIAFLLLGYGFTSILWSENDFQAVASDTTTEQLEDIRRERESRALHELSLQNEIHELKGRLQVFEDTKTVQVTDTNILLQESPKEAVVAPVLISSEQFEISRLEEERRAKRELDLLTEINELKDRLLVVEDTTRTALHPVPDPVIIIPPESQKAAEPVPFSNEQLEAARLAEERRVLQELRLTNEINELKERLNNMEKSMHLQQHSTASPTLACKCKGCGDCADVNKIVKIAIAKYDADKTGMADLALESAGGSILSTRCTKSSVKRSSVYTFFGLPFWHAPNNPRTIIQPGAIPGECWSYEGAEGFVVIQLVAPSVVTGFTLEHIPKSQSPFGHIQSAPKNFQVVGLTDYNDPETEFAFGSYIYEDNDEPIQYFPVQFENNTPFPFIELKIHSNHGSIEFTCIYRFRVHGHK